MGEKKWFQSITIWGAGAVGLLQALPTLIATIDAAIPGLNLSINPVVIQVLSIAATIVVIYGRLTAKTTLK